MKKLLEHMVTKKDSLTEEEHKKLGIALFNQTWDYMEKHDKTPEEDEQMLNTAYASAYHWSHVGKPINFQRSQWQLSRVYCIINRSEPAMYHATRCMYYTDQMLEKKLDDDGFADFDLAFAYEALARASYIAGDEQSFENYFAYATAAGSKIKDEKDREWFEKQLATIRS